MPYITKARRKELEANDKISTAGELNYSITRIILKYMNSKETLSYQTINDIMGALEGAKCEFYRRVVVPYENLKIKENGDVYKEKVETENSQAVS